MLFDDGVLIGGSKQRLLGRHLKQYASLPITSTDSLTPKNGIHKDDAQPCEVIYAGPDSGMAQVALAFAARLWGLKAVLFLNTPSQNVLSPLALDHLSHISPTKSNETKVIDSADLTVGNPSYNLQQLPPLTRVAAQLGARLFLSPSETGGRTLKDTQTAAAAYASDKSSDCAKRILLPFGLRQKPGEPLFEHFREAFIDALPASLRDTVAKSSTADQCAVAPPFERLWIVAGSGFLFEILHSLWPSVHLMIVQVGKKIWTEQLDDLGVGNYDFFVAPETFGQTAKHQPPYPTVPWYDAKLWQFVQQHGRDGDAIWNVARVTDFEAAAEVLQAAERAGLKVLEHS